MTDNREKDPPPTAEDVISKTETVIQKAEELQAESKQPEPETGKREPPPTAEEVVSEVETAIKKAEKLQAKSKQDAPNQETA
jgi:hypothetical protein